MSEFLLSINTPDGKVFEGQVESLKAHGFEGYLGILKGHAPTLTALKPGLMTTLFKEEKKIYALGEGVLEVSDSQAIILADFARPVEREAEVSEILKIMKIKGL